MFYNSIWTRCLGLSFSLLGPSVRSFLLLLPIALSSRITKIPYYHVCVLTILVVKLVMIHSKKVFILWSSAN